MTVWFTADTHLGHANMLRFGQRPFASVAEMDRTLIDTWNAIVQPQDVVWHLGDFAYRSSRPPASYLGQLSGEKHLVWGNHDSEEVRSLPGWASSQPYAEIAVDGVRIVLLHYAMRVWNKSHNGSLHLYGHSHGSLPGDRQSCDVGVDNPAWLYRPVSLREIRQFLGTQPERPSEKHHER